MILLFFLFFSFSASAQLESMFSAGYLKDTSSGEVYWFNLSSFFNVSLDLSYSVNKENNEITITRKIDGTVNVSSSSDFYKFAYHKNFPSYYASEFSSPLYLNSSLFDEILNGMESQEQSASSLSIFRYYIDTSELNLPDASYLSTDYIYITPQNIYTEKKLAVRHVCKANTTLYDENGKVIGSFTDDGNHTFTFNPNVQNVLVNTSLYCVLLSTEVYLSSGQEKENFYSTDVLFPHMLKENPLVISFLSKIPVSPQPLTGVLLVPGVWYNFSLGGDISDIALEINFSSGENASEYINVIYGDDWIAFKIEDYDTKPDDPFEYLPKWREWIQEYSYELVKITGNITTDTGKYEVAILAYPAGCKVYV